MRWGSAGRGRWITIYANPGHAFMVIRTSRGLLRYDTSGMDDGSRWDGDLRPSGGYVVRHPPGCSAGMTIWHGWPATKIPMAARPQS